MKRNVFKAAILLGGLLMISALPAQAHIRAGTLALQGSLAFSTSNGDLYNNENRTQLSLLPSVQYFVIDHVALGGRLGVESFKQGDNSSTSFLIGPSANYYFGEVDNPTIPYVGAGVFFRTISTKTRQSSGNTVSSNQNGTSIALSVGLAHFFREHLAITPEASINLESLEGNTGTTFMLGVGLAGFLY